MQVVLVMFRPDGQRRSFPVTRDVTVIGRREDCDFRIPLSDVSRKHCRLVKDADKGTVRAEDLGSSNGTFRNGQRIKDAMLSPGDTLAVGPVTFVLQVDGQPAEEEMQPVLPPADELQVPPATNGTPRATHGAGATDDDEIARILNAEDNVTADNPSDSALMDLGDSEEHPHESPKA